MAEISRSNIVSIVKFFGLVHRIILIYIEVVTGAFKTPVKKNIKGQNVLITGSGHGLGREMALKFARLGTNIVLVDINETNNQRVKEEVLKIAKKLQNKVITYSVDIRRESEVAKLAKKIKEELGDIDILVNNAGIVQCLPFLELSPSLVERTFENNRGHIVAVSSIAGIIGGKYLTDYCASKFAVVGLMESLDKEIHDRNANQGVHLTTVCPSSMSTGMFRSFTSRFNWLLPVLTADSVAESIVEAVLTNKTFIALPAITLFFHRLSSIVPMKVNYLVQDYLDYGVKPHIK